KEGVVRQIAVISLALLLSAARAADEPQAVVAGKSRALIVVGLPGDAEHEKLFADTARQWHDCLTESLDFEVTVLFGRAGRPRLARVAATRDAIEREVADLKKNLRAEERLWVLFLGHGDYDGERASFHLPGRDFHANDVGKLFAGIKCKEQVFWMT